MRSRGWRATTRSAPSVARPECAGAGVDGVLGRAPPGAGRRSGTAGGPAAGPPAAPAGPGRSRTCRCRGSPAGRARSPARGAAVPPRREPHPAAGSRSATRRAARRGPRPHPRRRGRRCSPPSRRGAGATARCAAARPAPGPRSRREAAELLGQARLHVVDHRHPEAMPQHHRREGRLLDGMDAAVAAAGGSAGSAPAGVSGRAPASPGRGRSAPAAPGTGWARGSADARDVDRAPHRVGQHVDLVVQLRERAQELVHRDRRPAVLVERLRCDDQDARRLAEAFFHGRDTMR